MKKDTSKIIKNVGRLVDMWLPIKIKYDDIPGISVGIVKNGKLIYSNGFGYTDLNKKEKPDEKTLYHIASISKTFTSVAIMQLVEKGELRLDDKVSKYIDWFKAKDKEKNSENITIRHLLSHRAGIFRDGDTPHWETGKFPNDLSKSFSKESLILENATKFKYTNYGFSLLGLVIEKLVGVSYQEYVEANILKPLKMNSTYVDYNSDIKNVATGYGNEMPGSKRKIFKHYKTNAYAPATGFLSNVNDLAKYLGALSFDEDKILSRESKKEMMHPYEKTQDNYEYGLGLEITKEGSKKIICHSGGFNGFITQVYVEPESGIGVIALGNTLKGSISGIGRGILKAVLSELENSKIKNNKPSYKKYEGLYRNSWGDNLIVQLNGRLISFGPGTNWPLQNITVFEPQKGNKDRFIMKNKSVYDSYDEPAVFNDFKNGLAQRLISGSMPAKRIIINLEN